MNSNPKSFQCNKEIEQIVKRLEQGSVLTRFYKKGYKTERRHLSVKLDTRQLIWCFLPQTKCSSSISVINLRDIKEVRIGSISKFVDRISICNDQLNNNNTCSSDSRNSITSNCSLINNQANISTNSRKCFELNQCFVVFYGTGFNLKTLTCAGTCLA